MFPVLLLLCLGVLQVMLYAHARDVLYGAAQEGARLAAEDGRDLNEGVLRTRQIINAGLGTSIEPVQLEAILSPDTVVLRVDSALRPILPIAAGDGLPLHVEVRAARERFRPGGGRG